MRIYRINREASGWVDFKEGDIVKLTAGQYIGNTGKVIQSTPDIREASVQIELVGQSAVVRVAWDDLEHVGGQEERQDILNK